MTAQNTPFAGLDALQPGDSLSENGYKFQWQDRYLIDALLKLGAVAHRHDAHLPLPDPVLPVAVVLDATGGAIPADTAIYVCYTLIDRDGGESAPSDVVQITAGSDFAIPTAAPIAAVDYAAGTMLAANLSYFITVTDGAGGETQRGPVTNVVIDPGHPNARVTLSGLTAAVASANINGVVGAGWRLWRQQGGGAPYLIATGGQAVDGFVDDGSVIGDCTVSPPFQSTTSGTSQLLVTVPGGQDARAVNFAIYVSTDGSFTSPARLGIYPITDATHQKVYSDLTGVQDGAPPVVSTAFPGANQIEPDTDLLFGFKSPVATADELPAGVRGDARISLDDNHIHMVLDSNVAAGPADWTDVTAAMTGSGMTIVGPGSVHQVWEIARRDDFAATTDPPTIADFDVPAAAGVTNAGMAVANGLLTTSDGTQTNPIAANGFYRGPKALANRLLPLDPSQGGVAANPDQPLTYQAFSSNGPLAAAEEAGSSGTTKVYDIRPPLGNIAASWTAVGQPDYDSGPTTSPNAPPAPVYTQSVYSDTDGTSFYNQPGDTLTVNAAAVNADGSPKYCTVFDWDGTQWVPEFIGTDTGSAWSPTGSFEFNPAADWWRADPQDTKLYMYRFTAPGGFKDGVQIDVHVKGWDHQAAGEIVGGVVQQIESFVNTAFGVVLNFQDGDNGLMYYVTGNGQLCGWSDVPSELLLSGNHHPTDALMQKRWNYLLGQTAPAQPPITYTPDPNYDPAVDGGDGSFVTNAPDVYFRLQRDGNLATAQVFFKDPALGVHPMYTTTYDLTGTPWDVATAPSAPVGIVTPYLLDQDVGIQSITVTDKITTDVWTIKQTTELDLSDDVFIVDEGNGKVNVTLQPRVLPPQLINAGVTYDVTPQQDEGTRIVIDVGAAFTVNVPDEDPTDPARFRVGSIIELMPIGAGQVSVTAGAGTQLSSLGGLTKIAGPWGLGKLWKRAEGDWVLTGDLTA